MPVKKTTASYRVENESGGSRLTPHFIHIGHLKTSEPWNYSSHVHPDHEWLLVRNGRIHCRINDVTFDAGRGDFYFVEPGQQHEEISTRGRIDYFSIRFQLMDSVGRPAHFFPPPGSPGRQCLRDPRHRFHEFFRVVFREILAQKPGCREIVEAMILQMAWFLRRTLNLIPPLNENFVSGYQAEVVNQAKHHIQGNFRRRITLPELARFCCVSATHLDHIFKRAAGLSPLQYAQLLRINEAKRLLANPALSVHAIADQLEFSDVGHFSRRFKKATELSPTAFRKKL